MRIGTLNTAYQKGIPTVGKVPTVLRKHKQGTGQLIQREIASVVYYYVFAAVRTYIKKQNKNLINDLQEREHTFTVCAVR